MTDKNPQFYTCSKCQTPMRTGFIVEKNTPLHVITLGEGIYWSPGEVGLMGRRVGLQSFACPNCGFVEIFARRIEKDRDIIKKAHYAVKSISTLKEEKKVEDNFNYRNGKQDAIQFCDEHQEEIEEVIQKIEIGDKEILTIFPEFVRNKFYDNDLDYQRGFNETLKEQFLIKKRKEMNEELMKSTESFLYNQLIYNSEEDAYQNNPSLCEPSFHEWIMGSLGRYRCSRCDLVRKKSMF